MALVELTREGAVTTLTLNRPDARNALSVDMCDAITAALDEPARDERARVLVVRGEGSAFCSGADIAAVSGAGGLDFLPAFERTLDALGRHRLPSIAMIHGAALGGGFQLAAVCDFRVATDDCKIGIPASKLGIVVNFRNVERLVLLAGSAVAKEVLMTGRTYSGLEAAAAGLVTRATPPDELSGEVTKLALELAARAPRSVQGAKRAIQVVLDHLAGARQTDPRGVDEIDRLVEGAYHSRDLQEGLRALNEKRDPDFQGI